MRRQEQGKHIFIAEHREDGLQARGSLSWWLEEPGTEAEAGALRGRGSRTRVGSEEAE